MKRPSALINFLNLSVGQATDAYLRELALVAIQSRQLTRTVERLTAHQHELELSNSKDPITPLLELKNSNEPPRSAVGDTSWFPMKTQKSPRGKLAEGRYFIATDGTVTDEKTKLMWMQNPLEARFTFNEADQAAKKLNSKNGFAGYKDWRVPNQKELYSLISKDNDPPFCQEAFPNTPRWLWTSTSRTQNTNEAWIVSFSRGIFMSINKSDFNHVRLVRQSNLSLF